MCAGRARVVTFTVTESPCERVCCTRRVRRELRQALKAVAISSAVYVLLYVTIAHPFLWSRIYVHRQCMGQTFVVARLYQVLLYTLERCTLDRYD